VDHLVGDIFGHGRSVHSGTTPGVTAVLRTHFKLVTGERAVIVVTAASGFVVVPETRGVVKRATILLSRVIVGLELSKKIGPLPSESVPRLLSHLLEYHVKRRTGYHKAARAAAIA
jgi:hypothetical protein